MDSKLSLNTFPNLMTPSPSKQQGTTSPLTKIAICVFVPKQLPLSQKKSSLILGQINSLFF